MNSTGRELELVRRELHDLRESVTKWQRDHTHQHAEDARGAVNGRRWVISTCLAAMVMLIALLALVAQVLGRTHG